LILFTDPWRSPIAEVAEVVIVGPVEVESPYDSLAPAMAQMEALIAHLVIHEARPFHERVQELERIRANNTTTIDTKDRG
jgi:DNA-binding MurR/RpiR family transcriptional regulator